MRVLMLNWRDAWHPKAGGAELVTLRVLERLAERGHEVEWFSGAYAGAARDEWRNRIHFVRAGSQATVHVAAWRRYARTAAFDIVVDQINTIPFYAHLYVRAPTIALIHQLAQEVWHYEFPAPFGRLGAALERFYLLPYRDVPIISESASSAASFRAFGLRGQISVVSLAVDCRAECDVPTKVLPREIVTLGRVTPSKRPEHAIAAAGVLRERGWSGRLVMIGGGSPKYVGRLKELGASRLGDRFTLTGRVSDEERSRLLRSASCIWMTSVREGWGLAITEAARHGTPAVVYRVPGLVDSVSDRETGFVVDQDPTALADATERLFGDDYAAFAERALAASRAYDWETTTDQFEGALRDRIATWTSHLKQ
jgi:glycosyltransferase involved in cell wall biosynthesis